jgi:AcrR family transcriptional regulator
VSLDAPDAAAPPAVVGSASAGAQSARVPRGKGRPPLQLDEQTLLDAATYVFANDGYFGASVDDIARRAGTSKALLFRRYGTKDALYDLAVGHEVRLLTEWLFSAYELADTLRVVDSIRPGVDAIIGYATSRPDGFRLLFQTGFTAGHGATPASEQVRAVVSERIAQMVLRRLADLDAPHGPIAASLLAAALVGASEHAARLIVAEGDAIDSRAAADLLAEFLSFGLTGLTQPALAAVDVRPRARRRGH